MLKALRSRAALRRKAGDIYGAIVTQARQPQFYAKLGIPDTPIGRYDVVVLHLFLVLERLRAEGDAADVLQRLLLETFVADMDDSLRELGTGDIVVGKKVRRAAAGFYERARDYRLALMEGDGALGQALVRHGLARTDASRETRALCGYVRAAAAALQRLDGETVQGARLEFPDVASFSEDTQ
jgi:cytochrome b pre-mRNA-processing protein 3